MTTTETIPTEARVSASRFVEEPIPCPGGARGCALCGGSGKHSVVREVPAEAVRVGRDGLCPRCRAWLGTTRTDHTTDADACGWQGETP